MRGIRLAATIIILILLSLGTVAAGIYTNGFESISALYLVADGEIYNKDAKITVSGAADIQFEVSGAGFTAVEEYEVQAVTSSDIQFTVNGAVCIWNAKDVTDELITVTGTGFTYAPKTTAQLIASVYGADAEMTDENDGSGCDYVITVTSGSHSISLTFVIEADSETPEDPDEPADPEDPEDPDEPADPEDPDYVQVDDIEITPDHIIY